MPILITPEDQYEILTWIKCGFAAVAVVILAIGGINHANIECFRHITLTLTVLSLLSVSNKSSPVAALPSPPEGSRARIDRDLHRISGTLSLAYFPMFPCMGNGLKKINHAPVLLK